MVGDLVDAQLPRPLRVTLSHCKQHKRWLRSFAVDTEYRAPAAVRLRNVVLDASAETGPVARFGLARAQGINGDTIDLELANRRLDSRARRVGCTA
jgi:hypothetical protein